MGLSLNYKIKELYVFLGNNKDAIIVKKKLTQRDLAKI